MTTGSDSAVTKAAIVTGSATGVGAAIARELASRSRGVAIKYTRSEREAEEIAACRAARTSQSTRTAGVSLRPRSKRSGVGALVNNAGTTRFVADDDMNGLDATDFGRIFPVNVLGAFQMTRAPRGASSDGAVVNISSYSGVNGLGSSLAYAASNGALNTLTGGLAHTLAPCVRANAVYPGYR